MVRFFSLLYLQQSHFLSAADDGQESDATLLEQISLRNEDAFEVLYDRYNGLIYSLSLQILDDPGLAEENTLDAFNQLWQRARDYHPAKAAVKTWLVCITRNRAIDVLRRRSSRLDCNPALWVDGVLDKLPDQRDPESETVQLDISLKVRAVLRLLPEEQQIVLFLAYFKGFSHRQIAEQLRLPLGTVKGRIRMAMLTLREKFAESF